MGPESTNGKICRGNFFCLIFVFGLSLSLALSLSRSLALSLFLSLIIIYTHICAWQPADSRVTTDHCRVTLRWLFTKSFLIAWNVQKRCLTVADGRVTSDHCRVTVQRHFSKKFLIAQNVQKRCLTVGRRSRDLRPLSRDRSATFFNKFSNCVKRQKIVVWQSADSRVTSDHCRVTVQWLISKKFLIAWIIQKRCLTVGRRSCNLNHCRVTVQRLFSKFSQIAWNVQKTLFDSRPTVAWPPTTVVWPFSDFLENFL